ncbi:MAG TPA: DUF3987 domain-containing protein, partial [Candidatus Cybelea sp.]
MTTLFPEPATGFASVFTGKRDAKSLVDPDRVPLSRKRTEFFAWPEEREHLVKFISSQDSFGWEAYVCAHLLTSKERKGKRAAQIHALWADVDEGDVSKGPPPTMVIQTSPDRTQALWSLRCAIDAPRAESLNKRLALQIGADPSGWDLTQLLRAPGMHNHKPKYSIDGVSPTVTVLEYDPTHIYDADELEESLPPLPPEPEFTPPAADGPPVVLRGFPSKLWRGEPDAFAKYPNSEGRPDRSKILWIIGMELAIAGASEQTIATAVRDRDEAFGFEKYLYRNDGGVEYHKIAREAVAAAERAREGKAAVANSERDAVDDTFQATPGALSDLSVAVPNMLLELVPVALRRWVRDVCRRMGVPVEMVAVPLIVTAAALIGRQVRIRPKLRDDWTVVPNLWGVVISRPGTMKSPAMVDAFRPFRYVEAKLHKAFETAKADFETKQRLCKLEMEALETQIRTAHKHKEWDVAFLGSQLGEKRKELEALKIIEPRIATSDPTVEKLGELLGENPRGLLLCRDELIGFLRTLERAGREGDRQFYLESWNGDSPFMVDRIGRGSLRIEALCLSLIGTAQPGPLRSYIAEALSSGAGADGLLQRVQLLVWPDKVPPFENVDEWPDTIAKDRVFKVLKELEALSLDKIGAEFDGDERAFLRFNEGAQVVFNEWRARLEARLRTTELLAHPALESHLAKYRSLMPALALVFHLIEWAATGGACGTRVSERDARLAADWCAFLELHAAKVY